VSKFNKIIRALSLLLRKPSLINQLTESNEAFKLDCESNTLYKEFPVADFNQFVINGIPLVWPFAIMDGGSLPSDIALLKAIAQKFNVANYFEIGTWRGESATNLSEVVDNVFTLNLSDNELLTLGKNNKYLEQQSHYSKSVKNIHHLKGNSFSFDFSEFFGKMDLVFVDGDHSYAGVKNDTEIAFKLIKKNKGIIVWHDYGMSPELVRYEVLKGIVDGTPEEHRNQLYAIENTLCAMYANEKISSKSYSYPNTPNNTYRIIIEKA
jgi:predicted O-methyltransferase YrrM